MEIQLPKRTVRANGVSRDTIIACLAAGILILFQTFLAQGQSVGGLIANQISFLGNTVQLDSFNSSDTNHSIWQTNLFFRGANYGIWSNSLSYDTNSLPSRTANITVAVLTNFIDVGNADIYGNIKTTPGGVCSLSFYGSVGDLNWVHSGTSGLQPGHFRDDMTQKFLSLSLPAPRNSIQLNNWLPVATGTAGKTNIIKIGGTWTNFGVGWTNIGGTLYSNINNSGWVLPNGDGTTSTYTQVITNRPESTNSIYYSMSILSGNLYIDSQNAVLYLTNGMSSSTILTLNTNADVRIYSEGNITFGTIINDTSLARALAFYDVIGHPISIQSSSIVSGTFYIYAPSSSIAFLGGGHNFNISGAIVAYSIELEGHLNIHYDESLGAILPIPVSIDTQPLSQAVMVGSNATFSVSANGATPISYQLFPTNFFQFHTNVWTAQTNSSFTLTNVQSWDTGNYYIVATNAFGSATSAPAFLFVYTNVAQIVPQVTVPPGTGIDLFNFTVSGATGLTYTVQSSTNLVDWVSVKTNAAPFTYFENGQTFPQEFYRVIY